MARFIVHLHRDVFYDVQVDAEDEDAAFDLALATVTDEHIDRRASAAIERSEATYTPVHRDNEPCDDPVCER